MHPDFSLVLQKCASNLSLKHKQPFLHKINNKAKNMSDLNPLSPEEQEDLVRIVSDEEDESREPTDYKEMPNQEPDLNDDNISMCSELSVGKENPEQEPSLQMEEEEEEILDISDTHSNSSNEELAQSSLVGAQESHLNPFALANTLRFPVPFPGLTNNNNATTTNISPFQEEFLRKSHLYAEELMKHQMQLMAAARASAFSLRSHSITPQLSSAPHLVNPLHPLAKIGQLSAAAAAALSAAAQQNHKPLNHNHYQQQMLQHHHQNPHLNHQQYDTLAKLTDLSKHHTPASNHTSSTTQQMMSTLNQLQTQMQAHLPGLLHDNNDNLHERALKFSIDNILKADFGRSNSLDSPPLQRKSSTHKSHNQRHKLNASTPCSSASSSVLTESLEHTVQSLSNNISPTTQTFSSSLATICTNSNDSNSTAVSSNYSSANGAADLVKSSPSQTPTLSPGFSENGSAANNKNSTANSSNNKEESGTSTSATGTGSGPIVWPAWVYCTRYSDRPSSGKLKIILLVNLWINARGRNNIVETSMCFLM